MIEEKNLTDDQIDFDNRLDDENRVQWVVFNVAGEIEHNFQLDQLLCFQFKSLVDGGHRKV